MSGCGSGSVIAHEQVTDFCACWCCAHVYECAGRLAHHALGVLLAADCCSEEEARLELNDCSQHQHMLRSVRGRCQH
jgi:hypothetical protein